MVVEIGIGLAAASGLVIARYALSGPTMTTSAVTGVLTFTVTLLYTIYVGAGPTVHKLGAFPTCRIVNADLTQPADCRPKGIGGQPLKIAGSTILLGNGRRLPIVAGRVDSNIEQSVKMGNGFEPMAQIQGWAASPRDRRPASAVLVFSSGRFVGAVAPIFNRSDVARTYRESALKRSGFSLTLALAPLHAGFGTPRLELFALEGGVASPMAFHCAGADKQVGC